MESLSTEASGETRRKSMDPVSEFIRLEELPNPGNRFVIQELIGTGTSSKVYAALDQQKGMKVAVKIISNVAENIMEIESEYRALCAIGGQGSVPVFHGAYMKSTQGPNKELWFVMELCEGIAFSSFLNWLERNNKCLSEEEIAALMKSMLISIFHLHACEIIHRDIRASNFILTPDGTLKLFDFGSCALLKGESKTTHFAIGASHWMAPEVIVCEQMSPYGKSCDVWSLGITAIELAEGKPPLHDIDPIRALFLISRNPPPSLKKSNNFSDKLKDFIEECLVKNADHRPCVAELMYHPFVAQIDDSQSEISLEELLSQGAGPPLSTKAKKILENIGLLIQENSSSFQLMDTPYATYKNGYFKCGPDSVYVRALPDDMAGIEQITEETILDLLHQRFLRHDYFTFIGDILVFVHPKKDMMSPDTTFKEKYCEKARSDNPPHILAVADRAYQQMMHHKRSQTIVFLGQSDSGKTILASEVINHLAFLGPISKSPEGAHHMYDLTRTLKKSIDITLKIQKISLLLDAFGNAQTSTNPNTSKHVKIITVTFSKTGKVSGALVTAKLLENYSFTSTFMTDCNFHLFYYLYEGLKSEHRLADFGIQDLSLLRYLPKRNTRIHKHTLNSYSSLISALRSFNFDEDEINSMYRIVTAILLLGDIDLRSKNKTIEVINTKVLDAAALNLGVDKKALHSCLTNKAKDVHHARHQIDSLALLLYEGFFSWIVASLNRALSFSRLVLGDAYSISIVDIPGCQESSSNEAFHLNCNILNDLLQNRVQKLIFIKELEEYKEEGLDVPFWYKDSTIHNKLSDQENESLNTLKALNKAAVPGTRWTKELDSFFQSSHSVVEKNSISIKHVHKQVRYRKDSLIPKNTASNFQDFLSLMKSSTCSTVSHMWEELPIEQYWNLYNLLPNFKDSNTTDFPHVVSCINPSTSKDKYFEKERVLDSFRCFNLVETTMIRKHGFARRILFEDFLNRYKYLAFDFDETVELTGDNCRLLLLRLKMEGWMLGKTKVFLKYYAEEYLSRLYERHVKKIVKVQAMARRFIVKAQKRIAK